MTAMKVCRRFVLGLGLLVAYSASATAQQAAIYSSRDRIHPVLGTHGMVSTQEAVATGVGLEILKKAGNAVDAAVAVAFALAVTLPRAGNLGGGGFMVVYDAKSGDTVAIDYREMAPSASHRDMFLDKGGNPDQKLARYSGLSVGVPGTVAGMALALKKYGTMSLADTLQPAIKLASNGINVTPGEAQTLKALKERLQRWPSTAKIFYKEGGVPYEPGETLVQHDLANTLRLIAEQGPDAFYRGAIAEKIVAAVDQADGIITLEDLANYKPVIRDPVRGTYRGYDIASMPPPSSGGTHIIEILNILEGYPIGFLGHNSAEMVHLMAEAMKLAYADRSEYLGDSDFVEVPLTGLTSKAYAAALRRKINRYRATPSQSIKPGDPFPYESGETTHFSIVDKDGNAVANTYTINFSYGSGLVAEGTGVLMNNEMDDFSAKPGVPNAYGLIGGDANAIEPRKRPLSSMSPTIVLKDGKPYVVTGSPGGSRIITTTLQLIMNVIDHGLNIAEATYAVRVHHQWLPDQLRIEQGLNPDTVRLLTEMGHNVVVKNAMGSTQSIMIGDDGILRGASDPRRPGALTLGY